MEGIRHRREFEEALRNELAKLERDGVDRIDRSHVEELGQRFELDRDEARKLFVDSRGDIWKGEFIESEEEPGWEAVALERVPSVGGSPEESSV
jgi:hypothetical protein